MLKPMALPQLEEDPALLEKKRLKREKAKQKKLARKKKALERKRKLQMDHLDREVKYGAYTLKKCQREWKSLLCELTKIKQKTELEFGWQNFENVLDIKDFIISRLMDEKQESEYQYRMNIMQFFNATNRLIAKLKEQLNEQRNNYHEELQSLKDQHEQFLADMNKTAEENMIYLKTMIYIMEAQHKDKEMNLRAEFCAEKQLAIHDHEKAIMVLRIKLEPIFESLWKTMNDIFAQYEATIQSFGIEYDRVKASDEKIQQLLSAELKKINHLCELIKKLRKKDESNTPNPTQDLKSKATFFREAFLVLKQTLSANLKFDKYKQGFLITEFESNSKKMQNTLRLGENLIKLLRACRKMETLEEKSMSYPHVFEDGEQLSKNHKLFLFWKRVGVVETSRSALYEEKLYLKAENNFLMSKLRERCSCWDCPRLPPIYGKKSIAFYNRQESLMKTIRNKRYVEEVRLSENDFLFTNS